jgi:hypothetical protein
MWTFGESGIETDRITKLVPNVVLAKAGTTVVYVVDFPGAVAIPCPWLLFFEYYFFAGRKHLFVQLINSL